MTDYEATMKRLDWESVMAWALFDMWESAEEGDFERAMHWQFVYLYARDRYLELPRFGKAFNLYWQLHSIAAFGGGTHEF